MPRLPEAVQATMERLRESHIPLHKWLLRRIYDLKQEGHDAHHCIACSASAPTDRVVFGPSIREGCARIFPEETGPLAARAR